MVRYSLHKDLGSNRAVLSLREDVLQVLVAVLVAGKVVDFISRAIKIVCEVNCEQIGTVVLEEVI